MQYCSLQHQTLLPSQVTSPTGCCFCFGSMSSFFLELFLHWSPVEFCAPTDLGNSSFSVIPFCLFLLFMEFSKQEYWNGLPFPSPVDHILSELSTMTHPSWVALHDMAHTFIELDKAVVHVISLISFLWCGFQSVYSLVEKEKRLMKAFQLERLTEGETGSCSDGPCIANFQSNFLLMVCAVFPPCYLTWGQTMVDVMKIMVTSFKRSHAFIVTLSDPNPAAGHCLPIPPPETPESSRAWLDQSLVGSLLLSPGPCCTQGFFCAL